jgi:hypothetical protein
MATYIPQVQGYVPQYQPFQPDFNFYAGALQMKQSQYDTAHKQLSTLYTSLLNSPLTRDGKLRYGRIVEVTPTVRYFLTSQVCRILGNL